MVASWSPRREGGREGEREVEVVEVEEVEGKAEKALTEEGERVEQKRPGKRGMGRGVCSLPGGEGGEGGREGGGGEGGRT